MIHEAVITVTLMPFQEPKMNGTEREQRKKNECELDKSFKRLIVADNHVVNSST